MLTSITEARSLQRRITKVLCWRVTAERVTAKTSPRRSLSSQDLKNEKEPGQTRARGREFRLQERDVQSLWSRNKLRHFRNSKKELWSLACLQHGLLIFFFYLETWFTHRLMSKRCSLSWEKRRRIHASFSNLTETQSEGWFQREKSKEREGGGRNWPVWAETETVQIHIVPRSWGGPWRLPASFWKWGDRPWGFKDLIKGTCKTVAEPGLERRPPNSSGKQEAHFPLLVNISLRVCGVQSWGTVTQARDWCLHFRGLW